MYQVRVKPAPKINVEMFIIFWSVHTLISVTLIILKVRGGLG